MLKRRPPTDITRRVIARTQNEGHVRLGETARKCGNQIDVTRTRKQHIGALVSKVAHQCRYGTGGEQPA
uniref:hypothetical protein n=1 Tax=Nitrosomonas sp. Nm33 TaxID=133724 RepID=UPI0021092BCF|nr:hypothetical protein [Nitrosomonas sp. Nm33]